MTDDTAAPDAATPAAAPTDPGAKPAPSFAIVAQYLRDLSFENPNPLDMLRLQERPVIDANVDVQARKVQDEHFEVQLAFRVEAKSAQSQQTAFLVEATYAGLFMVKGLPPEHMEGFLVVECARQLFPFARRVIADASRDGGFPPLMLDPIDFLALYQRKLRERQETTGGTTREAAAAGDPAAEPAPPEDA